MASRIRRAGAAALALIMLGMTPAYALNNNEQIENVGGTAGTLAQDGVEVSKTIASTGIENYFDITLTAKTQTEYTKKAVEDAHVVIVLDLSNTMNYNFELTKVDWPNSRYKAAMDAVKAFIDDFVGLTPAGTSPNRKIGVAAFNTSGHIISGLTSCISTAEGNTLYTTVEKETANIIHADGYAGNNSRFTNMEAGLKVAKEMLEASGNVANKMIIFLTDGYPTTYLQNTNTTGNYTGYEPHSSSGTHGADGVFYDTKGGVYCRYGTDYSDKAARRAAAMAEGIRSSGITIYSVGVAVTGQTMGKYEETNYTYANSTYPNGNVKAGFSTLDVETGNQDYVIKDFEKWLKGINDGTNKNGGIGSGYYSACDDATSLIKALEDMVGDTNVPVGVGTTAQSTLDPVYSGTTGDFVEFVGFFDKADKLQTGLTGKSAKKGEDGAENTAAFAQGSTA